MTRSIFILLDPRRIRPAPGLRVGGRGPARHELAGVDASRDLRPGCRRAHPLLPPAEPAARALPILPDPDHEEPRLLLVVRGATGGRPDELQFIESGKVWIINYVK